MAVNDHPPDRATRPGVPGSGSVFVGRSDALALLAAEFDRAAMGEPRTVWVRGSSGIGKTRLIRRFVESAPAHRLVWASGDEAERSLPFGIVDQIRTALGLRATPGATASAATSIPPATAARPGVGLPTEGTGSVDRIADEGRPVDALMAGALVLADLGSLQGPVILVVDDLQLSDRESLQALLFALRRLRAEPLLVVLTSGAQADSQWGPGWRRLVADPARTTTIDLPGLTTEELIDLARALGQPGLSPDLARRLHEHTHGHPLHSRSLLEEVGVSGLAGMRGVPPSPRSLAALVSSQVADLPDSAQSMLAAGAVLGTTFEPALAAQIAGLVDPDVQLDLIAASGLVESRSAAHAAFAHPLVRSAVYHGLRPSRRRALHAAAAARTGGDIAAQHRVFATAGFDAALAAEFDALAQRELLAGRAPRAAAHWQTASGLAPEAADRERMLLRAVALWCAVGEVTTAAALRPAVEACGESIHRTLVLGIMDLAVGRIAEASALLHAVAGAEPADVGEPWWTYAMVISALIRLLMGDYPGVIVAADRVVLPGLWQERALAEWSAVVALAQLGETERIRSRASMLAGLERDNPAAGDLVVPRGVALLVDDDLTGTVATLTAALGRMGSGGALRLPEILLTDLAEAEFRLGRWSDAVLHLDLAIAAAHDGTHSFILVRAHSVWVWICAARGDHDGAAAHLAAAEAAAAEYRSPLSRQLLGISRATIADVRGDVRAMFLAMAEAGPSDLDAVTATSGLAHWRAAAVETLVRAGHADVARDALARYQRWVAGRRHGLWTDHLARLRVLLDLAEGSPHDAEGLRSICAEQLERSPRALSSTMPRGRLHHLYGRLLLAAGRRRDAVEQFRAARRIFSALRARPFLAECDADLLACGLPARPASAGDPLALTDAEAKVAALVVDGMSNREVAEQLYLSQKTVEYHLGHIFTKLGVTSRTRLARALTSPSALTS